MTTVDPNQPGARTWRRTDRSQDLAAPRTALVTGANQNLGRSLVAGLAAGLAPSDRVILTGRHPGRVAAAARDLAATAQGGASIEPRVLDVRDPRAIRSLGADLGEIDIVFSNAASRMHPDVDPIDEIDAVVDTNNVATATVLRELAPRMRPGGRLVIVASALGTLDKLDAAVRPRFAAAAEEGLDSVERLTEEWRASVKAGRAVEEGFGAWLNIPSKVAQVAAVRAVAARRRADDLRDGILVMALCPGLIDTDASRPWFADMAGAQTPDQAATWPVEMALASDIDPTHYGELVQFGAVLPWSTGVRNDDGPRR